MVEVLTFGHGTATKDAVVALLHRAGVGAVVDVRTAPGSRRNPDMARTELQRWLPERDIDYRWDKRLGGFRKVPPDSPDWMWKNHSFRAYAAHMRTPDFTAAVGDLLDQAVHERTAIMCAESLWWRCHRRLIADFLQLARGIDVRHLMHDATSTPHRPVAGARVREDGLLVYDGGLG